MQEIVSCRLPAAQRIPENISSILCLPAGVVDLEFHYDEHLYAQRDFNSDGDVTSTDGLAQILIRKECGRNLRVFAICIVLQYPTMGFDF